MKNIVIFLSNLDQDLGFFSFIGRFLREEREKGIEIQVLDDKEFGEIEEKTEKNIMIFCFKDHKKDYPHPTVRMDRCIVSLGFFKDKIEENLLTDSSRH